MDRFGTSIQFRINDNSTHKSVLGGLTSVIFFMIVAVYISINFKDFITRQNMTLITTNKIIDPMPNLNLSLLQFGFGFGLVYEDTDESAMGEYEQYFDFSISYVQWDGLLGAMKIKTPITVRKCQMSNLYSENSNISQTVFDKYLQTFYITSCSHFYP